MPSPARKPLKWVGSAKRDLDAMPGDVKDVSSATRSMSPKRAASIPMPSRWGGFGSTGVLEVVEDHRGATYRAVYTVRFAGWVYVLHCFQRKSMSGIKTPREDLDLIHARLKAAKQDFDARRQSHGEKR